jgi:hypothetical protein
LPRWSPNAIPGGEFQRTKAVTNDYGLLRIQNALLGLRTLNALRLLADWWF